MYVYCIYIVYVYCICILYIYIYIYILKHHYKEIEKSILHKRMVVKKYDIYIYKYDNLKNPYISILTCLKNNCHLVLS